MNIEDTDKDDCNNKIDNKDVDHRELVQLSKKASRLPKDNEFTCAT